MSFCTIYTVHHTFVWNPQSPRMKCEENVFIITEKNASWIIIPISDSEVLQMYRRYSSQP